MRNIIFYRDTAGNHKQNILAPDDEAIMHYPRKRFGQHFLSDPNVISRITDVIGPDAKDIMVEIGPGKGALTYSLIDRVLQIHVVEIDRDLAALLAKQFRQSDKLRVHCADVLKLDFEKLLGKRKARVVGNLPYNISTALIFHLASFPNHIVDMHLMLQREVVQRLVASVDDKQYGRLSVIAQCCFKIDALFDVLSRSFTPSPKVVSTFAHFRPQPKFSRQDLEKLDSIVRLAFSNKRKTAANALSELFGKEDLEYLGIDPSKRVGSLAPERFFAMLKYLDGRRR